MCTGSHSYIPVENVAKVEFFFRQDGQRVENVFHVKNFSGWSGSALTDLQSYMTAWVTEEYLPCLHANLQFYGIKITDLTTSSSPVLESYTTEGEQGGVSVGAALPNNVSLVVKWLTGSRGRSYRGRTYIVGIPASGVLNNNATTEFSGVMSTAMGALMTVLSERVWSLVVVSYCNAKAWRTVGVATPISGYAIDSVLDSQRRRLPGRGN